MSSSLSNNSASETLTALVVGKQVAGWSGRDDRWRLLLVSAAGPVELEVSWGCGDTSGTLLRLSLARSVRLCFYGRAVTVKADNLKDGSNRIDLVAVDAYERTQNVLQVSGEGTGAVQAVAVPVFAQDLRLELEDATLLGGSLVRLKNGEGEVVAACPADMQPDAGIRLGAADSVEVEAPSGCKWRLVFGLTM